MVVGLPLQPAIGTWIYDTQSGKEIQLIGAHQSNVRYIAYSPDGKTLATAGRSHDKSSRMDVSTLRLWDTTTGKPKAILSEHTDYIYVIAYSPDGSIIASGGQDKTVRLWDAKTGRYKTTLSGHTDIVFSIAYSPDGSSIASGSIDKTVRLWDATTGRYKATLAGHTEPILSIAFSPDGTTIATASIDKTVRLWDATTGQHKIHSPGT